MDRHSSIRRETLHKLHHSMAMGHTALLSSGLYLSKAKHQINDLHHSSQASHLCLQAIRVEADLRNILEGHLPAKRHLATAHHLGEAQ
jgi:hypothetical protein